MSDRAPPPPTTPEWSARLLLEGKVTSLSHESMLAICTALLAATGHGPYGITAKFGRERDEARALLRSVVDRAHEEALKCSLVRARAGELGLDK